MDELNDILVVQTAFIGDVILTLPLVQALKGPSASIDVMVIPRSAELLANHPAIREVIVFDKRGRDSGPAGVLKMARDLRRRKYDAAFVPHRSLRSAALVRLSGIRRRIGFDTSAGSFLFTDTVHYQPALHEVDRCLSLLGVMGIPQRERPLPSLFPSSKDRSEVDEFFRESGLTGESSLVGIAPGTVWNTKRWPEDRFAGLVAECRAAGLSVVLIGGREDAPLCERICRSESGLSSAAGRLTLLQSAELIRRCRVLVSNDSAPMHLAVAMRTPVVALFGATVPEYGFAPYGHRDVVLETTGLSCRPCSVHGGDRCPIGTFECMMNISSATVFEKVLQILERARAGA